MIGGPSSGSQNGSPTYDLVENLFSLGNNNFGNDAFGVAIFDLSVSTTLPVHTLIYGTTNTDLVDELGGIPAPYFPATNPGVKSPLWLMVPASGATDQVISASVTAFPN